MHPLASPSSASPDPAERLEQLTAQIRSLLESHARQMAQALLDAPQPFGDIEFTLRDQAHQLASEVHQLALSSEKKRATKVPLASVPTAKPMLDSSLTEPEKS
jgi:hypothetical protein